MTRVSDTSVTHGLNFTLGKAKAKLEGLQTKGATLKNITKPSDDPVSNVEAMSLTSLQKDSNQFIRNSNYALMHLNVTEKSIEQLTDILSKAKEIAIAQSSDFYNADIRKNIANEVQQLRNLALSISNKRVGQKYIFAGFKTLDRPFDNDGTYKGDTGHMNVEVGKDFFSPINLNGREVFIGEENIKSQDVHPLEEFPDLEAAPKQRTDRKSRELASVRIPKFEEHENIFAQLDMLVAALENNDSNVIQGLLEKFDKGISRLITLRTRIGSIVNSIESSINTIESDNIDWATRKSKLVDADIAELFGDITKQQEVLKTTYKSSQGLLNTNLLDFLR